MAMIRCEMCDKFLDGDWVEMFENPEDPCSMVCIDCYTEWEEDLAAAKELMGRVKTLEGAIQNVLDGDYPQAPQYDMCKHGRYSYDVCPYCIKDYLQEALCGT